MSQAAPLFVSGIELASLVVSSDLLNLSWDANVTAYNEQISQPLPVRLQIVRQPNCTIVAFVTSPVCTLQHLLQQGGSDLVSSANFDDFNFLCSEGNPSFSIHGVVVNLFKGFQLDNIRAQLIDLNNDGTPLIITGHALGGSLACLFLLCLLDAIPVTSKKLPFCITFGSPLIGDQGFQRAIAERSKWNSRFLHVASNHDLVPRLFTSREHLQRMASNSQASPYGYKPFGTFFFCSESGCACVEDPEVVSMLLESSIYQVVSQEVPVNHYGDMVKHMKSGISCKGSSQLGVPVTDSLQSGLIIQLAAAGIQMTQDLSFNIVIELEKKEKSLAEKKAGLDPSKKLNEVKKKMVLLEWYKKKCKAGGMGYYDSYKNRSDQRDHHVTTIRKHLTNYWETIVLDSAKKPQKEGAYVRMAWLYAGINCKRMVEPLDIAEYYRKGDKRDYENQGRSEHYRLLEKWQQEDPDKKAGTLTEKKKQNVAGNLTEDSLFWARVEEALIRCRLLKHPFSADSERQESIKYLQWFQQYVMGEINKYALSPEVFLGQSSFIRWWMEFQPIGVALCNVNPSLLHFMNRGGFEQYEQGKY